MEYLIKVSTILVLFYLCYKFLLKRETFFESNRSFLLLGLITAFILPFITISKYITVEPTIIESSYVFNDTISQPIVVDNAMSITTMLTYIYLAGVLFFLGRFLLQFGSLAALLINSTKKRVASFIYVITKNMISPFSFFNWIVFNPNQFSDTELEQIITHEKVHAKQLHSIDILLAELICIILWFNPLVWLYKKDLRQNLEFIADKNAQATTNCKKSYQHLLLKTSVPNYQMALTNNFYNSSIKKRIVMLHKNRSHKRNQLKFLFVLPVLVLFLMSFNTKEIYIQAETDTKETPTISKEVETTANASISTKTLKTDSKPATTSSISSNEAIIANTPVAQDIVAYFIESTFTDEELDNVITKLSKHGVTLKIKGVKRNSDNKITAIKIEAKSSNSNANFSISNDSAIKTVRITYNAKADAISIGNTNGLLHDKDHVFTHKDGTFTIKKSGKGSNVFVYSSDDEHDKKHEVIEHDEKIIIKSGNKVHELKKAHNDENVFVISGGKGETFDIIHADTLESDGNIFKLKGTAIIKSKGENGEVIDLMSKSDDDNVVFIRKDKDENEFIISGKVTHDFGPVIKGAHVVVVEKQRGVRTNAEGEYKIKVSKGDKISYSFKTFVPQEVIIKDKKDINIKLSSKNGFAIDGMNPDKPIYYIYGKKVSKKEYTKKFQATLKQAKKEHTNKNTQTTLATSGTVTDIDGNPIPKAFIIVKGTSNGVMTNAAGEYAIKTTNGNVLVFSSKGMANQEIKVKGNKTINVKLLKKKKD